MLCPENSIFSAQWRECGQRHGSSVRQTPALQALKVGWDDPAAVMLPEQGMCWKEHFFKWLGHSFLLLLKLVENSNFSSIKETLLGEAGFELALRTVRLLEGPILIFAIRVWVHFPCSNSLLLEQNWKLGPVKDSFLWWVDVLSQRVALTTNLLGGRDKCQLGNCQKSCLCSML